MLKKKNTHQIYKIVDCDKLVGVTKLAESKLYKFIEKSFSDQFR